MHINAHSPKGKNINNHSRQLSILQTTSNNEPNTDRKKLDIIKDKYVSLQEKYVRVLEKRNLELESKIEGSGLLYATVNKKRQKTKDNTFGISNSQIKQQLVQLQKRLNSIDFNILDKHGSGRTRQQNLSCKTSRVQNLASEQGKKRLRS